MANVIIHLFVVLFVSISVSHSGETPTPPINNIHLVMAAFVEQKDMSKSYQQNKLPFITVRPLTNNKEINVKKDILAENYKVRDAFLLLQNYPIIVGDDRKLNYVQMPIAGQSYSFGIQPSFRPNVRRQVLIKSIGAKYGIGYEEVFTALDKSGIDQREAARYILEASNALINDERPALYWTEQYPFLDKPAQLNNLKMRDVLNEIMIVGQVAEAAAPTEEYFNKWMEISDRTTVRIQTKVQQIWREKSQKVLQQFSVSNFQMYEDLFSLAEELSVPDTNTQEAKKKVNELIGAQSVPESVYKGLIKARADAVQKGQEENNKTLSEEFKEAELKREGRAPFADEVFRITLRRIANTPHGITVRWRDYFPCLFPMHKIGGGTEIGRYDIIHSKHIRDNYKPPNASSQHSSQSHWIIYTSIFTSCCIGMLFILYLCCNYY